MCGIAGVIDFHHHLENQEVIFKNMIQSMKHRGPDDEGMVLMEHAALMHARLSVVDLENGKQPMRINHYVIVYNGECYNTEELRNKLIKKGARFFTQSDTEVILNAYIFYKEKCLSMINGIFAFAIFDTKTNQLFLARDPMGVKPLFYTSVNQTFLFASEIKTLLTHPLVPSLIDASSIHQLAYLGPGRISGNGVFKNIYELKPGEYGLLSEEGFHIHSYFSITSHTHQDDFITTLQTLKKMVTDSVERQLVSDVELGAFLSGGLDSSIICAIASRAYQKQNKKLKTFSLEFENDDLYFIPNHFQPSSDTPFVEVMVKEFQTDHTVIRLKSTDLIDALYEAVDARDLPGMADIDAAMLLFCKEVKKHVDVVLSGECADEIFGGYPWFTEPKFSHFPWSQNIEFRNSLLLDTYKIDAEAYIQNLTSNCLLQAPLQQDDTLFDIQTKQMTYLNMYWFMQTLLDRKDRMSMKSGLEARVPFCDASLIQYVYSIPWRFKHIHDREKGLLREAMKDLLPEKIIERKKSPFPKTHHPMYLKILREELSKLHEHEPLFKIFNFHQVKLLLSEECAIPWYGQLMTTPQTIAYLLQINYWLKKYQIQIQSN